MDSAAALFADCGELQQEDRARRELMFVLHWIDPVAGQRELVQIVEINAELATRAGDAQKAVEHHRAAARLRAEIDE